MQARARFVRSARNPLRRSRGSSSSARNAGERVRFAGCPRNPLQRSCVSSARNASESAIWRLPAQPSAEIVRVECAKCRREYDLPAARAPSAKIVRVFRPLVVWKCNEIYLGNKDFIGRIILNNLVLLKFNELMCIGFDWLLIFLNLKGVRY